MYLLNVDRNAKTIKGQKKGYLTGIVYLAPHDVAGVNVCSMSELAGCRKACLFTAGHAGFQGTTMFTAVNGSVYSRLSISGSVSPSNVYLSSAPSIPIVIDTV